jgi:copper chaperone CopZ
MELSDLPGVKSVDGDVDTKQVIVTFESPATTAELEKTLTEIDYPPAK